MLLNTKIYLDTKDGGKLSIDLADIKQARELMDLMAGGDITLFLYGEDEYGHVTIFVDSECIKSLGNSNNPLISRSLIVYRDGTIEELFESENQ